MTDGEDRESILKGLNAIYPVSRETMGRLTAYRDLLVKWQTKTNLVSPATLPMFWSRHIADSLQVVALKPAARRWTDLGSGGGFPGLVIAAALSQNEGTQVRLIESNRKKCAFLQQTAQRMKAPVEVHCARIESAAEQMSGADVITARALAPLPQLLEWAGGHIAAGSTALFMKGRDFRKEIADCHSGWKFDLIEHPSRVDPSGCILEITNVSRR